MSERPSPPAELSENEKFVWNIGFNAGVESMQARVARLVRGECPSCGRKVKDWKAPFGAFAPEAWATLRERGIDPSSGHTVACPEKPK